jgi:succinoglycan biosynthesis transport protein ExoP
MSVDFRQRRPGEYGRIIWKRKWLIILPAIAVAAAVAIVVWRLPNVYESTTLLIVKPPTIPDKIVPTLSDSDLSLRINSINQVVLSRSTLEPLILKYNLYQRERLNGEPMENVVEKMRDTVAIEIEKGRDNNIPAFRIFYRERDPRITQAVTAELASQYVSAQTRDLQQGGAVTKEFFDQQLAEAKARLDALDQKRVQYMQEHVDSLPSSAQALLAQYTGLREQQKSLTTEKGRLNDRRTSLSGQLADVKEQAQRDNIEIAEKLGDPKDTQAYGNLVTRKATLEGELQNMLSSLKPGNPDVKAKQIELDAVKREMKQMEDDAQAKVEAIRRKRENNPDLRINGIERDIETTGNEINRLQTLLDQNGAQIGDIERRINDLPTSEVALDAMNREYATQKLVYDDLLMKSSRANLGSAVASQAQGETIQVLDPANLPQSHVAPKRLMLTLMGLGLGLGVGLFCAVAFEVPRLLTIQTVEDAAHYTGLPVLVSVPELLTPQEARRIPQRRMLLLVAGIVATIISIPALAFALKMTRLLDRFVQ